MQPEVRSIRPTELEDFLAVARLGFGFPSDFKVSLDPEWTLCAFLDGRLVTSYAAWPLKMYFSGAVMDVAGITWVSTHPLYRRRDCLRQVTATHFRRLHEFGGQPVSALHASMASIYQRYGYAVVTTNNRYSVEPQYLRFAAPQPPRGTLREASEADIDSMVDIYNRYAAPLTGMLKRGPQMQNAPGNFTVLMFHPPAIPMRLVYREGDQDLGYVIYGIMRDVDGVNPLGQKIMVSDIACLTPAAYQAIWNYFANMDIITRVEWGRVPADDPLPHLLLEPRKLNTASSDGMLARLVDVERALPQRRYSDNGVLTFEVLDDFCPWNQGKWILEATPAGNEIRRYRGKPQLTLPVSTLAMLFFGQINATQAAAMGRLTAVQPEKLALWDRVMRTAFRPASTDIF